MMVTSARMCNERHLRLCPSCIFFCRHEATECPTPLPHVGLSKTRSFLQVNPTSDGGETQPLNCWISLVSQPSNLFAGCCERFQTAQAVGPSSARKTLFAKFKFNLSISNGLPELDEQLFDLGGGNLLVRMWPCGWNGMTADI